MRKVLITGGPTNEYIDEVMKITNMSSGYLAVKIAEKFASTGDMVTLLLTKTVRYKTTNPNIKVVTFETTESLIGALKTASQEDKYDIVIHSSAVADYAPEYSFKLEDMASELAEHLLEKHTNLSDIQVDNLAKEILDVLKNPACKVNDDTKISSNEPNLTVKHGLTPKIIASLREWFPEAYICGFKLLENVPEKVLTDAAYSICTKNNIDLVFANDLAKLRKGITKRYVVNKGGYNGIQVDDAEGIYNLINIVRPSN